jgi:hypothetical protein
MKKVFVSIWEFMKEYSTYNYHSGKRYRRKHKIGEYKEN